MWREFDLFDFYRKLLLIIGGTYALVVTIDKLRGLWQGLRGKKHLDMARKYLVIQLLRLRLRDVWLDVLHLGLWAGLLGLLIFLHRYVDGVAGYLRGLST